MGEPTNDETALNLTDPFVPTLIEFSDPPRVEYLIADEPVVVREVGHNLAALLSTDRTRLVGFRLSFAPTPLPAVDEGEVERLRAVLGVADRALIPFTPDQLQAVARAIDDVQFGYGIRLFRLVDDVSTYKLTIDGEEGWREFPSHGEALEFVTSRRCRLQALAALAALPEPLVRLCEAAVGFSSTRFIDFRWEADLHLAARAFAAPLNPHQEWDELSDPAQQAGEAGS